jgi:hypothetical protein
MRRFHKSGYDRCDWCADWFFVIVFVTVSGTVTGFVIVVAFVGASGTVTGVSPSSTADLWRVFEAYVF